MADSKIASSYSTTKECLFCKSEVMDNSFGLPSSKLCIDSLIKFLYFHKSSIYSKNQSTSIHPAAEAEDYYYRSIFQSSFFYCKTCTANVESIIKTIQQLEELEEHLYSLQRQVITKLQNSLCSQGKFNKCRHHIVIELQSNVAVSDAALNNSICHPADEDCDVKLEYDTKLVPEKDPSKAYVRLIRLEESHLLNSMGQRYTEQLREKLKNNSVPNDIGYSSLHKTTAVRIDNQQSFMLENGSESGSENHDEDHSFDIDKDNFCQPKKRRRYQLKDSTRNHAAIKVAKVHTAMKSQHNLQFFYLKCYYPTCNLKESAVVLLKEHVKKSHIDILTRFEAQNFCEHCGANFNSKTEELKKHIKDHEIRRHEFCCKYCSTTTLSSAKIHNHFQSCHPELHQQYKRFKLKSTVQTPCKCNICNTSFIDHRVLWRHIRTRHLKQSKIPVPGNDLGYKCAFCSKVYSHQNSLRKHESLIHKDEILKMSESTSAKSISHSQSQTEESELDVVIKDEEDLCSEAPEFCNDELFDKVSQSSEPEKLFDKEIVATHGTQEEGKDKLLSDEDLIKLIKEQPKLCCQYTNCEFANTSYMTLESHVVGVHFKDTDSSTNDICRKCGLQFSNQTSADVKALMKDHFLTNHSSLSKSPPERLICKICPRDFNRPYQLIRHFLHEHSKMYQDVLAGKEISSIDIKNVKDGDLPIFECKFCSLSFPYKFLLVHAKHHHEDQLFQTSIIDIDDKNQTRKFKCNFCTHKTPSLKGMRLHQEQQHPRLFIKDSLNSSEVNPITISNDSSKSSKSKGQYNCEICGSYFAKQTTLLYHAKKHNKAYPCSLCSSGYSKQEFLTRHQSNNHAKELGLPLFQCDQCEHVSTAPHSLKNHVRAVHNKEVAFMCEICPYKCFYKVQFKRHMLVHRVERPFKCPSCPARFNGKGHLAEHLRIHTGEKPFVCVHCGRTFRLRKTWMDHEATHGSERPYPCALCGVKFPTSHNLDSHVRCHHKKKGIGPGVKPTRKSKYNRPENDDNDIVLKTN